VTDALVALALGLLGLGAAWTLMDWRKGVLVCVVVGFLQDPLRKLWVDEPVYLTALVGAFLVVVLLGAALRGELLQFAGAEEWRTGLRLPVLAGVAVVLGQAARTLVEYDSLELVAIGVASYLLPAVAAALAYAFATIASRVRRFLAFYTLLTAGAASGVYLGFLGYDWTILEQVGQGLVVFSQEGVPLEVYPGFMRSPEVAGWHAAAAICLLVILGTLTKSAGTRLGMGLLVVFLLGAGLLTARRKVPVEIVLFLLLYWLLLAWARVGARKATVVAVAAGIVGVALAAEILDPQEAGPNFDPYVRHGVTGFAAAPERFTLLGFGSVQWAIQRHGVLGAGAGTGSQGAQHFGGGAVLVGGAPEGGLGKVATELGVPGLLVSAWLAVALARALWRSARQLARIQPELAPLGYGLLGFLAANAVTFLVASQVYGDLFVLLILGWAAGFALAGPRLTETTPPVAPAAGWR